MKRSSANLSLMLVSLALSTGMAFAQQANSPQGFEDILARQEQQNFQIQQLQEQLANLQRQQGTAATPTAFAPLNNDAASPPASEKPPEGYTVGSDTSIKPVFKAGNSLWFETPNKDFTMHLGGWVQWDSVWWGESPAMKTPPTAQTNAQGVAAGGIGPLEDGTYFRRIRIVMEGAFWETCEYRWNFAPENIQYSTIGLDEMWVGINKLPLIGTVRFGHVKTPMGLEGDMVGSSRSMTFMERSSYSEAIELNQNFGTGVWLGDTYLDDRGTWSFATFRPDNGNSGAFFGDNRLGVQGRITTLPFFEDEGRHLVHLGLSGGWRNGVNSLPGGSNYAQLRARPELRDDDPAGVQAIPNANSYRMIDTGRLICDDEYLLGLEALYIRGPLSFQAEYGWNFLNGAQVTIPVVKPISNYVFDGGYLQVAYTLTGESRAYDKKAGTFSRYYFGTQGPKENAFLVRDDNGHIFGGWGAWEVACRYSYVNLNSQTGPAFVNGGMMQGVSLGLNWYLNTNLTVNTEWVYNSRYDLPGNGTNPGNTTVVGDSSGFGTRMQLSF